MELRGTIPIWLHYTWHHSHLVALHVAPFPSGCTTRGTIPIWLHYMWHHSHLVALHVAPFPSGCTTCGTIPIWLHYMWHHSHLVALHGGSRSKTCRMMFTLKFEFQNYSKHPYQNETVYNSYVKLIQKM